MASCGQPEVQQADAPFGVPNASVNVGASPSAPDAGYYGDAGANFGVGGDNGGVPTPPPSNNPPATVPGDGPEDEPGGPVTVNASDCSPPDPSTMTACCGEAEAYCRPPDSVPANMLDRLDTCPGGDACVPAAYMGAGYEPVECSSLGGAPGACVSICVKDVKALASILPQDVCDKTERCTPCIDPTDGQDTGACTPIQCVEDVAPGGGGPVGGDPAEVDEPVDACADPPTNLIDPNLFPSCCPGAHCVPKAIVPAEFNGLLGACDNGAGFCVPAPMISSGGKAPPQVCTSVGGTAGRCMSTCIPQVAEQAADLPVDICSSGEVCTPCCDPFTGQTTGACDTECDTGPPGGQCSVLFTPCCDDIAGHCISKDKVPSDKQGNLEECANDLLCVPDVMQDLSWKGSPCSGVMLFGFGDFYTGVCLPRCLKIPLEFAMDGGGCQGGYLCAPCKDPFLGLPTGAPGC